MKTRNGWVSNSSSSSFLCLAYSIKDKEADTLKEQFHDLDEGWQEDKAGFDIIDLEYEYMIGKRIKHWSDDLQEDVEVTWKELEAIKSSSEIEAAKKFLGTDEWPSIRIVNQYC